MIPIFSFIDQDGTESLLCSAISENFCPVFSYSAFSFFLFAILIFGMIFGLKLLDKLFTKTIQQKSQRTEFSVCNEFINKPYSELRWQKPFHKENYSESGKLKST